MKRRGVWCERGFVTWASVAAVMAAMAIPQTSTAATRVVLNEYFNATW